MCLNCRANLASGVTSRRRPVLPMAAGRHPPTWDVSVLWCPVFTQCLQLRHKDVRSRRDLMDRFHPSVCHQLSLTGFHRIGQLVSILFCTGSFLMPFSAVIRYTVLTISILTALINPLMVFLLLTVLACKPQNGSCPHPVLTSTLRRLNITKARVEFRFFAASCFKDYH